MWMWMAPGEPFFVPVVCANKARTEWGAAREDRPCWGPLPLGGKWIVRPGLGHVFAPSSDVSAREKMDGQSA